MHWAPDELGLSGNYSPRVSRWLPSEAPGRESVDTALLGREVALTGGQIRNAALHAAVIAAGNGGELNHRSIALGVWNELRKESRPGIRSSLGGLRAYLPDGASECCA